ncbi:hypothetical protein [Rhodococcus sp. ACPA1]|uniref:hypothetical protein n=1 Tax=Rhodococcus sp. ACPA1 TaxID=2028572 RepID=UPI00211C9CF0|nr:hypothetical protein [Rhodococcus sp. ACPA1]
MSPVVFEPLDELTLFFGLFLGHRRGDAPKVENHRLSRLRAEPTTAPLRYPDGVVFFRIGIGDQCEQCGRSPVVHTNLLTRLGSDSGQHPRVNPDAFAGGCAGGAIATDCEAQRHRDLLKRTLFEHLLRLGENQWRVRSKPAAATDLGARIR